MTPRRRRGPNNFIGEWFGHRVYPIVADLPQARADQQHKRCPFLTEVTGAATECIKADQSKGVCTISSTSNGTRQDWLVCPFRALDERILDDAARRLFEHDRDSDISLVPAKNLETQAGADRFREAVNAGKPSLIYFQNKLGGEISISPTPRSPEFSFDATMVEVLSGEMPGTLRLGRYGIFEIQTMDFHGTYKAAVNNLVNALHLHRDDFGQAVEGHPEWLAEKVEGPNIANVFKRTFYQMMFKFQIGDHGLSAGCIFAIPRAVWDSWQRHLGAPDLVDHGDGTWRLKAESHDLDEKPPAWIYVFDTNESASESPNTLVLWRVIGTSAEALAHYALDVAPRAALEAGGSVDRLLTSVKTRLLPYLPELV